MIFLLVVAVIVLGTPNATAVPADTTEQHGGWTVLPILFSSPDTGFGFGVLPQYVFRTSPAVRASNVRTDVYYTQEGQFNVTGRVSLWQPGNRYRLSGRVQLREWPTTFYGIGNAASGVEERYTERSMMASAEVQRKVRAGLYAGAGLELAHRAMRELEPAGRLASGEVTGATGGQSLGLGVSVSFDTRDAVFFPTAGHLVRLEARIYGRVGGADFGYSQYRLDARQYVRIRSGHVLALHAVGRASAGTPPFQALHGVGEVVRGYSSKRYADQHLMAVQAEYRVVPLAWRLGFAVFAGAGQVAGELDAWRFHRFRVAAGIGLRFLLDRTEKVTIRWDFGFGADSSGDYLDLNEAF